MKKSCEMCGNSDYLKSYSVEGTVLGLCSGCSKFGKLIKTSKPIARNVDKQYERAYTRPKDIDTTRVIVDDVGRIIRNHRNSLGLTTDEYAQKVAEKATLINKVESGKLAPSLKLAEKLERLFGLKLITYEQKQEFSLASSDSDEVTIGDIIKFK